MMQTELDCGIRHKNLAERVRADLFWLLGLQSEVCVNLCDSLYLSLPFA